MGFFKLLSSPQYERLPTNALHPKSRFTLNKSLLMYGMYGVLGISTYTAIVLWCSHFFTKKPYSYLDNFEHINNIPLVRDERHWSSSSSAVFSSLYSDSFALAVAVLGHSIRRANVSASMILPYIETQVSSKALCIAQSVGWKTHPVGLIAPPRDGEDMATPRFRDQYTKLNIWKLGEELGFNSAVYMDADTLVLRNFDELFHFPWEFGAGLDVFPTKDARGFSINFNAGVLVFRPSQSTFEDMKSKLETSNFPLAHAEQSFLNAYFGGKSVRLPFAYNANMVIKQRSRELWAELTEEMRILHYTLVKPFWHNKMPEEMILTPEELQALAETTETRDGGLYREEIRLWSNAFDRMMEDQGDAINACY
ncbi:nucleotide-diphospho-sugar transferase [Dendrothele bispora CBS 962.96]|uniref:Nucleotide-diphospho-sugar transferase n=1 Tax=Dendrothele bispora (strain CBS 962.96) TaxID=1314807 RepID=A0A4S8MH00_DENBC|nr:nucleotide-diphospho-sugar transferase [Dendrothele bispora CBS 962.96]